MSKNLATWMTPLCYRSRYTFKFRVSLGKKKSQKLKFRGLAIINPQFSEHFILDDIFGQHYQQDINPDSSIIAAILCSCSC